MRVTGWVGYCGYISFRKKRVWVGSAIAIMSASIFVCTQMWMTSRSFMALNTPISLARGDIKSRPFRINLKNYYSVRIDTGWQSYFDPNCPSYDNVRSRWMLYKDGTVFVRWIDASSPYAYLGDFLGEKGTYELRLDILSDTVCLNPGRPRLLVYTDRGEYDDRASPVLLLSAFGVAFGVSLVILTLISAELGSQNVRICDSHRLAQYFQWAQTLPLKRQFESSPAFALVATPILVILVIAFNGDVATISVEGFVRTSLKARSFARGGRRFSWTSCGLHC